MHTLRTALAAGLLAITAGGAPAAAQSVSDPALTLETVVTGLSVPTTMGFVGPGEILVLQKNDGVVQYVVDGVLQAPALDVAVSIVSERGLLGIAVNPFDSTDVFLFYTEALSDGGTVIGNRIYRYVWNPGTGKLEDPTLVRHLPVLPGANHDGGILVHDGTHLYAVIGDLNRNGQLENFPTGAAPDDTAVILRMLPDGSPAPGNPFTPYCSVTTTTPCVDDTSCPGVETCTTQVARYWAYGVRNSFGMALDPVTGDLWDTENGPNVFDEINRVPAGFNSGWERIMGPPLGLDPNDLFHMPGAGNTYGNPAFTWVDTNSPTAIVFPAGSNLGTAYDDVALVADNNAGQIYRFPLNGAREAFNFTAFPALANAVAENNAERDLLTWASGFIAATDLKIGPDGALYVVSIALGAIYRISGPPAPEPVPTLGGRIGAALAGLAVALAALRRARYSP